MSTPDADSLTRSERLDRLPFTRLHGKLLMGSGVGWALDAMDVGLISFIMTALVAEWGLGSGELSLLASIGFVLSPAVGAILMSASTIVVALNAQLLRRLDLHPDAVAPMGGEPRPTPPVPGVHAREHAGHAHEAQ